MITITDKLGILKKKNKYLKYEVFCQTLIQTHITFLFDIVCLSLHATEL